jgi:hypothetical protein
MVEKVMSTAPASSPELPPANPFWLRAVHILCACTLLAILIPWAAALLRDANGRWSILYVLLLYSPLWTPFAWVFCRLSANPDSFIIRRSLILVASWAMLGLVLSSIFALVVFEEGGADAPSAGIPAAIAALQLLLFFSSVKTYFSMQSNRDYFHLLIPRLGAAILVGTSVLILSVAALAPKRASNEASSVGSLRTIYAVQTQFAQDHPRIGFATSLAQLGPTPGAELIDGVLASGTKSGYIFAITSTAADTQGRVTKYTATARPIHYNKATTRSFLTDESGAMHYTIDNRAPTPQDPAVQ